MRIEVLNVCKAKGPYAPEGDRRTWRDWGKSIRFKLGSDKEQIAVSFIYQLCRWDWGRWQSKGPHASATILYVGPLRFVYSRRFKKN